MRFGRVYGANVFRFPDLSFFFCLPGLIRLWRSVGGWSGSLDQMAQVRILIFR